MCFYWIHRKSANTKPRVFLNTPQSRQSSYSTAILLPSNFYLVYRHGIYINIIKRMRACCWKRPPRRRFASHPRIGPERRLGQLDCMRWVLDGWTHFVITTTLPPEIIYSIPTGLGDEQITRPSDFTNDLADHQWPSDLTDAVSWTSPLELSLISSPTQFPWSRELFVVMNVKVI